MPEVTPFPALRYEPARAGRLDELVAPPYDVVDPAWRRSLLATNPRNVVAIDLPHDDPDHPERAGDDPYTKAAETVARWLREGILVREEKPALWVMRQRFTAPDGQLRTRTGFFARVRVEPHDGTIRPHERTQPGPKEDRLRLTRATRLNLSPIFSVFPDPDGGARAALAAVADREPAGRFVEHDGTSTTFWRVDDPATIEQLTKLAARSELLIADGHHRYETARTYAREVGGEGPHQRTLMFLCPLSDPGLELYPIHRLLTGIDAERRRALWQTLEAFFDLEDRDPPAPSDATDAGSTVSGFIPGRFGVVDPASGRSVVATLRRDAAQAELAQLPPALRELDAAILEHLVLRRALALSDEDIANKRGISYTPRFERALQAVATGDADVAFLLRATPIEQVRAIAADGVPMPPKSTFFYPKVPTGIVFNPLDERFEQ
ncbi:DUF1015 domain-containing protein [Thermoleophilum album]|uniref:DUF1015 domain-containing protein n=1 Tax=Thermoleophilum album TaxID=29539 RepID=UPI00237CA2C9|nr:DUF1015 domain-containing protein [Thermoleophilum album]WDT93034.1 DUF1015 domain-containing protein [Thermoleophilum album]